MPSTLTSQPDDSSLCVMSLRRTAFLCSLLITCTAVRAEECKPNYFGANCEFKCHCKRGLCEQDGRCPEAVCHNGYFGPNCQYLDLLFHESSLTNPGYLLDNSEETCNPNSDEESLVIDLNHPVILYWIRVYIKNPFLTNEGVPQLQLTLDRDGECTDKRVYRGPDFMDITCSAVLVFKVSLKGKIVGDFCSLHFSGGRNVAMGQRASQSSTWQLNQQKAGAQNAIDGNTNTDFETSTACTRTDPEPTGPTWSLVFEFPQIIFNAVIIADKDETDELGRFRLRAMNSGGAIVFTYDHNNDYVDITTKVSPFPQEPISSISILQMANVTNRVLTLCEVEVYGETICLEGFFGLNCKDICSCQYANMCRAASGLCMTYETKATEPPKPEAKPNVSTECPRGFFGAQCLTPCPAFCISTCDRQTGNCGQCDSSHTGEKCEECSSSSFGPACSQRCPDGCLDACDAQTGNCFECKESFEGPMCDRKTSTRILIMTGAIVVTCLTIFIAGTYFLQKHKKTTRALSESASSTQTTDLRRSTVI